jgi:hypothetical protein
VCFVCALCVICVWREIDRERERKRVRVCERERERQTERQREAERERRRGKVKCLNGVLCRAYRSLHLPGTEGEGRRVVLYLILVANLPPRYCWRQFGLSGATRSESERCLLRGA